MRFPSPSAYQEALQFPSTAFLDAELAAGSPRLNALGLPQPVTGAFAVVFPIETESGRFAAKCFLTEVKDQQTRYAEVSRYLERSPLPSLVGYAYQKRGIRVEEGVYPLLKMAWVDGEPLNQFVRAHLSDRSVLEALCERWIELVAGLERAGVAHGDLQHGNILVRRESDGSPRLFLVDYDTLFVPALKGRRSPELGHRNYQHSDRSGSDFDERLDRFSALVIHTALRASLCRPELWDTFDTGENLLFQADDFFSPDRSVLFQELESVPELTSLVSSLEEACYQHPLKAPSLMEVLQHRVEAPVRVSKHPRKVVRERAGYRTGFEVYGAALAAAGLLVAGVLAWTHPVPAGALAGVTLASVTVLAAIRFFTHDGYRRRRRLDLEKDQIGRVVTELERELGLLEAERLRFLESRERLREERLSVLQHRALEEFLKFHFIGELESVDGITHKAVVRLKKAGIRTAFHITPESLSAVSALSEETRARVRLWHAALVSECGPSIPQRLSESEVHRLDRHVQRRQEEISRESERLRERIKVQRLEESRVLSRYEGVPDPGFGHYLLYCLHLRSENPLRTAIPASVP